SFWIGNVLLMILNVPLIGVWVKLLQVPYRYLFPSAMFFIVVGVFTTQNDLFQTWEVLVFGVLGALFMALDFPMAPILLGVVLGPMMEENFRRALLLSRGNMAVFVTRPISGGFIAVCALVVIGVSWSAWRASRRRKLNARAAGGLDVALGLPELELRSDD
ncbi:MAG: hypothetical protein EPN64_09440, partial [Burkholderiaceae bacterium]